MRAACAAIRCHGRLHHRGSSRPGTCRGVRIAEEGADIIGIDAFEDFRA